MRHNDWFLLRMVCLLAPIGLAACAAVPTLEPALGFVKGAAQIPQGRYLFVEYASSMSCSNPSFCPCPAPGPVRPAYYYASGFLSVWLLNDVPVDAHWSVADLPASTLGFLGYGEYYSHLSTYTSLPYESPDKQVVIYSADSQGRIAAQVFGNSYFFKPGQSWTDSSNEQLDLPVGCHYVLTERVTNYGLLTQDQIVNGDKK